MLGWGIQHDIDQGRATLNFSEWNRPQEGADNAADLVAQGEMPPTRYSIVHSEAQLSAEEKQLLAAMLAFIGGERRGRQSGLGGGDGGGRNRAP